MDATLSCTEPVPEVKEEAPHMSQTCRGSLVPRLTELPGRRVARGPLTFFRVSMIAWSISSTPVFAATFAWGGVRGGRLKRSGCPLSERLA